MEELAKCEIVEILPTKLTNKTQGAIENPTEQSVQQAQLKCIKHQIRENFV
jgi:hypothetical protein